MEVSIRQDKLSNCLNVVEKGLPSKTTLPVLNGVLVEADVSSIRFVTSNLELSIQAVLNEVEIIESGKVILPDKFVEIVRHLSAENVSIKVNPEKLQAEITSGKAFFNLFGMDANEFPYFSTEKEWTAWDSLEFSALELRDMIKKIIFAVSHDEGRPLFRAIMFHLAENRDLTAVATDTYRLARLQRIFNGQKVIDPLTLLVPGKTMNEIIKVIDGAQDELVKCYFKEKEIIFCYRHFTFSSRLVEGKFPEVKSVFPDGFKTRININKLQLEKLLHRAILLAHGQNQMIMLKITDNILNVRASSSTGNMDEELDLEFKEGEDLENILLNARFLLEPLRVMEDENVLIEFNGPFGPCIFCREEEKEGLREKYQYLVLPIKTESHS